MTNEQTRPIIEAMKSPEGTFRNWEVIRAWARARLVWSAWSPDHGEESDEQHRPYKQ